MNDNNYFFLLLFSLGSGGIHGLTQRAKCYNKYYLEQCMCYHDDN